MRDSTLFSHHLEHCLHMIGRHLIFLLNEWTNGHMNEGEIIRKLNFQLIQCYYPATFMVLKYGRPDLYHG